MKRILLISSLSLAVAAALPGSAGAQDTLKAAGTVTRTPTYQSLVTSIAATETATTKVMNRSVSATDIRVVNANTVVVSDDAKKMVKTGLDTHKDHLTALRTAIANNPSYTAALAAHKDKPVANDVIAVDIQDAGDVLVYFRK
jgi:hypothetical protein